ncbi:MFS transporter [Gordonibacter sp.]|uniref:MFS transporter n=1 Tax=Gordonibacter sp. TaxID=1968902 RepID=UPI002FC59A5B
MSEASPTTKGAEKFLIAPILVLVMAQIGTTGENSAMSLAATAFADAFGSTTADFQLANMVYSLVAGALMIAGGMMGIIIGWKKSFRIGVLLCAAGEVVVALSPSMMLLTWGGRTLVGLGASFMIPAVLGLIPNIYHSGKNRAIAFGCIGAASGIATILPILFGVLMDAMGFRITFGILACYFLIVFAASFSLPPIEKAPGKLKFDYVGTGLAALGLFMFLVGLSRISVWGLIAPTAAAPFSLLGFSPAPVLTLAGLIVLAIMMFVEKKVEAKNGCALLPQSFYKTPQVLAGLLCSFQIFFSSAMITLLVVPYLQRVAGWSAMQASLIAVAIGVPMFLLALGIPKVAPKMHPRTALQFGYALIGAGTIAIVLSISSDSVSALLWVGAVVIGLGEGCLSAHASNVVALAVNDRDASQSGGVQATSRNVGYAISIAALGATLLIGLNSGIAGSISTNESISPETRAAVAQHNVDMMSNENFVTAMAGVTTSEEEMAALVAANADARTNALRTTLTVGGVIVLLSLLSTPFVKVARKENEAEIATEQAKQPAVDTDSLQTEGA